MSVKKMEPWVETRSINILAQFPRALLRTKALPVNQIKSFTCRPLDNEDLFDFKFCMRLLGKATEPQGFEEGNERH